MSGRPLRFLGGTLVGWIAIRTVMLWPALDTPGALPRLLIPVAQADPESLPPPPAKVIPRPMPLTHTTAAEHPGHTPPGSRSTTIETARFETGPHAAATEPVASAQLVSPGPGPIQPFAPPIPGRLPTPRRWSGSVWLVLRNGREFGSSFGGGQLGGAQAGARIAYAVDRDQRLSVVGRMTSPLRDIGREGSIGVEWRPTPLPVRLVVEHRFALDGGRGGPAAGVIAGTGPAPFALGFDLETYGQAGVIRRDRAEPFAEGAARLSRSVTGAGSLKLDLGVGTWGAAQRGAQRLDIGPTIGVTIPIGSRTLRAIGDWRQRVGGRANPGSGPALTIGADF